MRKSTFVKIAHEMSWLERFKNESIPASLDIYSREIEDILKMVRQAVEEDTCVCWEPEMSKAFLNCLTISEAAELYDVVMDYAYDHSSSKGVTLQQMLYEGIIDHNAVVSLWEKDEKDPRYSNRVWKGEFWKLPLGYKDRIGQIHGVMSDPKDAWGDDVHVELLPKVKE